MRKYALETTRERIAKICTPPQNHTIPVWLHAGRWDLINFIRSAHGSEPNRNRNLVDARSARCGRKSRTPRTTPLRQLCPPAPCDFKSKNRQRGQCPSSRVLCTRAALSAHQWGVEIETDIYTAVTRRRRKQLPKNAGERQHESSRDAQRSPFDLRAVFQCRSSRRAAFGLSRHPAQISLRRRRGAQRAPWRGLPLCSL